MRLNCSAREEAAAEAKMRPVSRIRAPSASAGGNGSAGNKGSSSILDDPMKIASVKRDNAYRGLLGVRKEYEDARQEMLALGEWGIHCSTEDSDFERALLIYLLLVFAVLFALMTDAEKRKLEGEVQAKRRLALLLSVLKKRETARLARLGTANGGLGALLSDLR